MSFFLTSDQAKNAPRITYPVSVELTKTGMWSAQVVGWEESRAEGETREEALHKLEQRLTNQLATSQLVHLNVLPYQPQNPWLAIAGLFQDDPEFDQVLAEIERDRQEVDAEFWQNQNQLEDEV